MPAIVPAKLRQMSEATDPKRAIMDAIGDATDKIRVPGGWVLVGTYIPPGKSAGGILFSDRTRDEALWQGSLGLVLKLGTTAFQDDDVHKFHEDDKATPGDWVLFRFSSAWEQHLNGVSVRFVPDTEIKGITSDPSIWTHRPMPGIG